MARAENDLAKRQESLEKLKKQHGIDWAGFGLRWVDALRETGLSVQRSNVKKITHFDNTIPYVFAWHTWEKGKETEREKGCTSMGVSAGLRLREGIWRRWFWFFPFSNLFFYLLFFQLNYLYFCFGLFLVLFYYLTCKYYYMFWGGVRFSRYNMYST